MRVHLLSFSIGFRNNEKVISRFKNSAKDSQLFDSCYVVKDVADPLFAPLYSSFGADFFLNRGFGFWAWKPYIISNYIKEISGDDVLIYADIGCEFSKSGRERLSSYLNILSSQDILAYSTRNSYPEYCWTKASITKAITTNRQYLSTEQIAATVVFLKKTNYSKKFLSEWNFFCCKNNGSLLDDNLSDFEHKNFIENRHDQSIFSLLYKIRNLKSINRKTWFPTEFYRYENSSWLEPIHQLRNKTEYPIISNNLSISRSKLFLIISYIRIRIFMYAKRYL